MHHLFSKDRRRAREQSRAWRGGLAAFGVAVTMALGLVWPAHSSSAETLAVACSQLPSGMPHHSVITDPGGPGAACDQSTPTGVKRCTTGVFGAFLVGFGFGGPIGALSGAAGGAVGCVAGSL